MFVLYSSMALTDPFCHSFCLLQSYSDTNDFYMLELNKTLFFSLILFLEL